MIVDLSGDRRPSCTHDDDDEFVCIKPVLLRWFCLKGFCGHSLGTFILGPQSVVTTTSPLLHLQSEEELQQI